MSCIFASRESGNRPNRIALAKKSNLLTVVDVDGQDSGDRRSLPLDEINCSEAWKVGFDRWRMPLVQASAHATAAIATAYGVGFAVGQLLLVTLIGVVISFANVGCVFLRSPLHGKKKGKRASGAVKVPVD